MKIPVFFRSHYRFILIGVLLVLAWGYWQMRANSGKAADSSRRAFTAMDRPQMVSAAQVERKTIREIVSAIGTISAQNQVVVRAKVEGELQKIYFREGDWVKAGEVLAQIDPTLYDINLSNAQGQLAKNLAQLANAQSDLIRYEDLWQKDAIAKQQLDGQRALVRQWEGTVQSDRAQVASAQLNRSYTQIRAPISGRLGLKNVDVGNMVRPSDANGMVTITQMHPINVVFAVPEIHLPKIQANPSLLPLEVFIGDQKNPLAQGKVSAVDNAVDINTGTIKIKATLPNTQGNLYPNQFATVKLQIDEEKDALAIPAQAIMRGTLGTYVYVINDDLKVKARTIQIGVNDNDWVSVRGDINPGDRVVIDGADRLREGSKIEIAAATPSLSSPSAFPRANGMEGREKWESFLASLPSQEAERVRKMSPEERRAHMAKMREGAKK